MKQVKAEETKATLCSDQLLWDVALELLRKGHTLELLATGTSMSPFIRNKDVIGVRPCNATEVRFGDIILYATSSDLMSSPKRVHRFIKRSLVNGKSTLLTKGDAMAWLDPPVGPDQVLGKVSTIKKGRRTLHLNQPWGKAVNLASVLFHRWPLSRAGIHAGYKVVKVVLSLPRTALFGS